MDREKSRKVFIFIIGGVATILIFLWFILQHRSPKFEAIPPSKLEDYKCQTVLWRDSTGNNLCRYEKYVALSENPEKLIFEKHTNDVKSFLELHDAGYWTKVNADTLYFYDHYPNYLASGWWNIERYVTGWRKYLPTSDPIGRVTRSKIPSEIDSISISNLYNRALKYENGKLIQIANLNEIGDPFDDIKGEGLFYISQPGIGLKHKINLKAMADQLKNW